MDYSKYLLFTIPDFLGDDDFARWVISPAKEDLAFWADFISRNPEKETEITAASQFIRAYRQQDLEDLQASQDAVFARIKQSVAQQQSIVKRSINIYLMLRAAAVIVLVCAISLAFWFFNRQKTIITGFAQVRSVELPDHSIIVLNSNSRLTFYANWAFHQREVWIDGEGYFKVKHLNVDTLNIKPSQRFTVHTGQVNVAVLGTVFDLRNRHNRVNVALINGKVRLDYADPASAQKISRIMKPGEYVELYKSKLIEKQILRKPSAVVSWIDHKLVFKNPLLGDIIEKLTDEYGYNVKISNPELVKLRIDGDINVPTVANLLEIINTALPVKIYKNNKVITITPSL